MNKNLLFLISLSILISLDVITTFIGVNYFNGIELNPICNLCNGINEFLILKIGLSILGIYIFAKYFKTNKECVYNALSFLNILYATIIISNTIQLIKVIT